MARFKKFSYWKQKLSIVQVVVLIAVAFGSFTPQGIQTAAAASTSSGLSFQNFESGSGFISGIGATVTPENDSATPEGKISAKMVSTSAAGWPEVTGNYIEIMPQSGGTVDLTVYDTMSFYVKDITGGNGPEV
jgi:hypothetical protein